MSIVEFITGLLAGAVGTWLIARILYKSKALYTLEKERNLLARIDEMKEEVRTRDDQVLRLTADLSASANENKNITDKLNQQKEEISALYEKMNREFKLLASEILEEKTKKFTLQNKENLDQILNPLKEKISDFEKKVETAYVDESKQRFSLQEEVKNLAALNQKVSEETKNLTRALKGDSKTQGNWGEMILENILEKSGLVRDREYFVQQSLKDDEGRTQRPDIVVEYPGDRCVIIDSKVSLTAYEKYFTCENRDEQEGHLSEHLASLKTHILSLSKKNYQELYKVKTLDFVMLFMPVEPAYLVAIEKDPDLWNFAYERRILLMSPTNLIAALKMISSLWRQEFQNRNAREIAKKSGELLDKFYSLLEDLLDLGNKLKSAQKSYDDSMNKLQSGKGNLMKRAKDIEQLGAKSLKAAPRQLSGDNIEETNESKPGEEL